MLVYSTIIVLAAIGLFTFVIFTSLVFYIVLVSLCVLTLIFIYVFFLIVGPSNFYKKALTNEYPASLRIYDDKVEEVNLFPDGKELRYVCKYEFSKCREFDHYLFVKTRNVKQIVGILINKDDVGEEKINYIKEKLKK